MGEQKERKLRAMLQTKKLERISVFKKTHDDWYPSYTLAEWHEGNEPGSTKLVKVTFLEFPHDKGWRVCVWGGDDDGKERDYELEEKSEAFQMFIQVISQEYVNKGYLKDQGFTAA